MDELASLDNELMSAEQADLPVEEEVYNGNRVYDPGPNDGRYGYIEVEQDGVMMQCTNAYTSKAYGGQYCVGDTYTDPNGGSQAIRAINPTGIDLAPAQWDAEETYADVGEKLGMSMEEWTEFSAEIQQLNEAVDGLKGNMFGPTEQQIGRLGIRIRQENPDWTEEQIMAEANRMLEEEWKTSDAYAEAAAAETALFEQYGIQKENPGVYGSGIWVDEDGKYHKFESSSGNFYQTSQDTSFLDVAVPVGIALGASIIGGQIGTIFTGSMSGAASGAVNATLGSAISQGAMTGSIDPSSLLQAAMLGGIGGFADQLRQAGISEASTGLMGAADDAVKATADMLGVSYNDALELLQGVAEGAVSGGDLESIVAGAVGNYTSSQIQSYLKEAYGDTLNVEDWFKDGESHIPTEALNPIIDQVVGGIVDGTIDDPMSWGQTLWNYFQAGGDVDFMLPEGIDFPTWMGGEFGCPEWAQDENGECFGGISVPKPDCLEGESWDELLNKCMPDINIPKPECLEGESWDELLSKCVPDINIPKPECLDGEEWDQLLNKCVPIDVTVPKPQCLEGESWSEFDQQCIPDVIECLPGFEWDGQTCVELIIPKPECLDGEEWDQLLNKCVPITIEPPKPTCLEGESWSELDNKCIPDVIECMQGWEWSDLYGKCVEKIDDSTNCPAGWVSENGHCVEIKKPECPEGWKDEDGTCIPIDIPNPCEEGSFLDEAGICRPSIGGGNAAAGHDFQHQGLFDYTNIDVYQGTPLEPWKAELNLVRGMLS